jgi:hypothetical protein
MAPDQDPSPGDLLDLLDAHGEVSATTSNLCSPAATALDDALQQIAEQSQVMTHGGGSAIALREGQRMFCRARAGSIAPPQGSAINFTSGLTGEAVRSGQVLVCEDSETDLRVDVEVCRALGIRSLVVLPVNIGAELTGIFEVFSPERSVFGQGEVQALESMRELIVSVVRPVPEQAPVDAAEGLALDPEERPSELAMTLLGDELPAPAFCNDDPEDDLVCELEAAPVAPLPAFSPKLPSPGSGEEEKKLPRALVVAGVATLLLVLVWLNWCSQGVQRPVARHLPLAPLRKSAAASAVLPDKTKPAAPRHSAPQRATAKISVPISAELGRPAHPVPPPASMVDPEEDPPPVASVLRDAPAFVPVLPSRPESAIPAQDGMADSGIDVLQRAADKGDPQAQLALAVRYAEGNGVARNYAEALRWFSRAQSKGVLPRLPQAVEARERTEAWVVEQMGAKP